MTSPPLNRYSAEACARAQRGVLLHAAAVLQKQPQTFHAEFVMHHVHHQLGQRRHVHLVDKARKFGDDVDALFGFEPARCFASAAFVLFHIIVTSTDKRHSSHRRAARKRQILFHLVPPA